MRHRVAKVLVVAILAPIALGCQQTTMSGQSPLTPTKSTGALAPVRPTSSVSPFGGSRRVPPPPTGGFSVPNNYMGGTAPANHMGSNTGGMNQAAQGPSLGSGFVNNPLMVQPASARTNNTSSSGWVQSGSSNPAAATANNPPFQSNVPSTNSRQANPQQPNPQQPNPRQATSMRSESGGMKVIDLTQAPPPPGYRGPNGNQSQPNYQSQTGYQNQTGYPNTNAYQAPMGQFSNRFAPQFQSNVAPASFNSRLPYQSPSTGVLPQSSSYRPSNDTPAFQTQPVPLPMGEFEARPAPLAPSWEGVSASDDKRPSTEPVGTAPDNTASDLPWRRPDLP